MVTRIARPPIDLTSFLGRKWLESLVAQNVEVSGIASLQFILLASDATLPNARRIVGSANISITDGGAGSTLTLNLVDTAVTPGTYNSLTVDQKGRVTAGTVQVIANTVSNSDGTLTISPTSGAVVASINLNHANTWLQDQSVPDEAYGAGWNGSVEVPTKNAVYDKIEAVIAGIPSGSLLRHMFFAEG